MTRREFLETSARLAALPGVAPAGTAQEDVAGLKWDAEGQERRRQEVYSLHQRSVGPLFDAAGTWVGNSKAPTGRERLWNCFSFLTSNSTREKANAIISATFTGRAQLVKFSTFEYVAAVQILARNDKDITAGSRDLLRGLVTEALNRHNEIRSMGYNDNFPAMETEIAVLGGQLLGDQAAIARGREGMHRCLEMLERRGMLSEYTSSTYSATSALSYADVAEYAEDAGARAMALEIERRVWADVAAHFHPSTNILAGPHSRAYSVDSTGHLHQVQMMIYQAFGSRLWMNPPRFMFPPVPGQVVHHDGDVPFMQVSTVLIASSTYHPTAEIEAIVFDKPLPYQVMASSEFGSFQQSIMIRNSAPNGQPTKTSDVFEYPAGEVATTTYMTEDYSLGTATVPFLDGDQTDVFFVTFRRGPKPDSLSDVSTIYSRFTVDDEGPGLPWTDPRNPGREITTSLLGESGRVHAVQKRRTAIVAYQSKSQFLGEYKALRLTIIVPTMFRDVKNILVGSTPARLPFSAPEPDVVWLEDDFFYAALRPLIVTNHGRSEAMRIQQANGYLSIELVNYSGPPRNFSRQNLYQTLNGFVVEVGGPGDYGSFHRFRERVSAGTVKDAVYDRQRVVEYSTQDSRLAVSYSLALDGLKYISVDGKLCPRPKFDAGG